MTVELRVGTEDLLRCRFALSPLWETVAAVRTLADPRRQAYHLPWLRKVHGRLSDADLAPLIALLPSSGYTPDFLTPPPAGPLDDVTAELDRVAATPLEQVARELHDSLAGRRPVRVRPEVARRLLDDPAKALRELVALLRTCWTALLADQWPRLRDLLDNDIAVRSRQLADGGLRRLIKDLHASVHWHESTLRVAAPYRLTKSLGGQGLLLMPSAFVWPALTVVVEPPWQPTLIYPARGIADLWHQPPPRSGEALHRLIGRTRAELLLGLDDPVSTTALARQHGVSAATASAHLAALRDAGLVTSHRVSYAVLYRRTALGTALCHG
ncbi:DUF5937 family protein [Lentzea xinjiangensis]|uniref:DUF5937 family protein n=1 Tax=Lentzea xinjiangensis TaxID=402600 RepID=UPI001FE5C99F|nr:DUF5937 family protein [Lentzea xinjiangensis]